MVKFKKEKRDQNEVVGEKRTYEKSLEVRTVEHVLSLIKHLYVFHSKARVCLYYKSFTGINFDPQLIGGFISAITSFGEFEKYIPKVLEYLSFKVLFEETNTCQYLLLFEGDMDEMLSELLLTFIDAFESIFLQHLTEFDGDVSVFSTTSEIISDVFSRSERLEHISEMKLRAEQAREALLKRKAQVQAELETKKKAELEAKRELEIEKTLQFRSDKPDDMIANIYRLHGWALEAINNKHYDIARDFFRAELDQYGIAIKLLVNMELARPAAKADRKMHDVAEILYTVEDTIYVEAYRDLYNILKEITDRSDNSNTLKTLETMVKLTRDRLELANKAGKEIDIHKYKDVIATLSSRVLYYKAIMVYKEYESRYNGIRALATLSGVQAALTPLKQLEKDFTTFREKNLLSNRSNDPAWTQLTEEVQALKQAIESMKAQIESYYEQMIENMAVAPPSFTPIEASLAMPTIAEITLSRDVIETIADLDRQFAEWDKNANSKDGKS